ncbi:hypothetical protein KIW84_030019 [Lathyrus oleraceus]|uniref:Uncharacterized protein n=1 Tax=Pisum sativum TaxID=3888 RepID=A0A9D5AYU5_PEA|nr:hypothetical protein KIW84_030019 [Pisum sativum]
MVVICFSLVSTVICNAICRLNHAVDNMSILVYNQWSWSAVLRGFQAACSFGLVQHGECSTCLMQMQFLHQLDGSKSRAISSCFWVMRLSIGVVSLCNMVDLAWNKLVQQDECSSIPDSIASSSLQLVLLNGNLLEGQVPDELYSIGVIWILYGNGSVLICIKVNKPVCRPKLSSSVN